MFIVEAVPIVDQGEYHIKVNGVVVAAVAPEYFRVNEDAAHKLGIWDTYNVGKEEFDAHHRS